jgi:hypothetical protein
MNRGKTLSFVHWADGTEAYKLGVPGPQRGWEKTGVIGQPRSYIGLNFKINKSVEPPLFEVSWQLRFMNRLSPIKIGWMKTVSGMSVCPLRLILVKRGHFCNGSIPQRFSRSRAPSFDQVHWKRYVPMTNHRFCNIAEVTWQITPKGLRVIEKAAFIPGTDSLCWLGSDDP